MKCIFVLISYHLNRKTNISCCIMLVDWYCCSMNLSLMIYPLILCTIPICIVCYLIPTNYKNDDSMKFYKYLDNLWNHVVIDILVNEWHVNIVFRNSEKWKQRLRINKIMLRINQGIRNIQENNMDQRR